MRKIKENITVVGLSISILLLFSTIVSLFIEQAALREPFIEVLAILLLIAVILLSVLLGWVKKDNG